MKKTYKNYSEHKKLIQDKLSGLNAKEAGDLAPIALLASRLSAHKQKSVAARNLCFEDLEKRIGNVVCKSTVNRIGKTQLARIISEIMTEKASKK